MEGVCAVGECAFLVVPSVIVPKRESRMVDIEETYVTTEPCRARGWGE